MVFHSVAVCAITFLSVDTVDCFFKVYVVGIDCAVPFFRLLYALSKSKDVVTAGSPFTGASFSLRISDVLCVGKDLCCFFRFRSGKDTMEMLFPSSKLSSTENKTLPFSSC